MVIDLFRYNHNNNFSGITGMEHDNSRNTQEGERGVIDTYRQCDSF